MLIIPAPGRLRQEEDKIKASLDYNRESGHLGIIERP